MLYEDDEGNRKYKFSEVSKRCRGSFSEFWLPVYWKSIVVIKDFALNLKTFFNKILIYMIKTKSKKLNLMPRIINRNILNDKTNDVTHGFNLISPWFNEGKH